MVEEKKRYDSGAVVAGVLGVGVGIAILAVAAASASAGGGKPKPPPPPKKGCTTSSLDGGFLVDCSEPGPDSLMEFRFDQGFYIESMSLEADLTGIGALDGTQKGQVTVRLIVLDEAGTVKKEIQLFDFITPTKMKTGLLNVGVIGRSVIVEAVGIADSVSASAPSVGFPFQALGPRQLTLTRNGRLRATVM
jgi:hypothetical protein